MIQAADAAALRARLRHVYWIGGGSGAGKSVIAGLLAARYGLGRYATDDVMADHGRRCAPADGPFLREFAAMDMDQRWVKRSPETMLETFGWFRGEGFGLIVDDLLRLPAEPGVIAEGFRLLPRLVQPLLAAPGQAVWLLPTPGFRRAAFDRRGSSREIARPDQRSGPGAAQPARAGPDVHRTPPPGNQAAGPAGHRGRHRHHRGGRGGAGGGSVRARPGARGRRAAGPPASARRMTERVSPYVRNYRA